MDRIARIRSQSAKYKAVFTLATEHGDFVAARKHWKVDLVQLSSLIAGIFIAMIVSYRSH